MKLTFIYKSVGPLLAELVTSRVVDEVLVQLPRMVVRSLFVILPLAEENEKLLNSN